MEWDMVVTPARASCVVVVEWGRAAAPEWRPGLPNTPLATLRIPVGGDSGGRTRTQMWVDGRRREIVSDWGPTCVVGRKALRSAVR